MTATTNNADPSNTPQKIESYEVGWMFVQEYYTFLNKDPSRLHCFYNKKSTLIHGIEGEQVKPYHGQQDIHAKILELAFDDCRVLVSSVDSQASLNGGIMIQVLGEMSNKGGPSQKFAQTFFLAEQPNGYFVLNDIFRFLKEEVEEELDYETDILDDFSNNNSNPTVIPTKVENPLTSTESIAIEEPIAKSEPVPSTEELKVPSMEEPTPIVEEKIDPTEPKVIDVPTDEPTALPIEVNGITEPQPKSSEAEKPAESTNKNKPQNGKGESTPPAETKPVFKSWANLAANGRDKWGSQVADVRGTVASVSNQKSQQQSPSSTQQQPSQPPQQQQQAPQQQQQQNQASPQPPSQQQPSAQPQRNTRQETSLTRSNGYKQDENLSVFVKGVQDGMTPEMFKASFGSVGTVKAVDVIIPKNCAFIEFTSIEAYKKAVTQSTFVVNGQNVYAEERRKNPRQSGRPNYNQGERRGGYHQNGERSERGGERGGRRGRGGRPFNRAPVEKHTK